jgi:hypothetical protein
MATRSWKREEANEWEKDSEQASEWEGRKRANEIESERNRIRKGGRVKYTVRVSKLFAQKLRTGPWQYFGGTTTHHSLPLDKTASKYRSSRSRWGRIFRNSVFPKILSFETKNFFQKSTKNHQILFRGAAPRTQSLRGCAPPTHQGRC